MHDVADNKIRAGGAYSIRQALEKNTTIAWINLSGVCVCVVVAVMMVIVRVECGRMGCQIGDRGAEHIARALEKNSTVKVIDLKGV